MAARSTKLIALAVATGTLVVAGSLPATASEGGQSVAATYAGATNGFALNVALNLPALTINETIASANGKVTKTESATSPLSGSAQAALFTSTGPTAALFDALNKTASAQLGGTQDSVASLVPTISDPLGLIHVNIGKTEAHVTPGKDAAPSQLHTGSSIADINVGLGGALAAPVASATQAVTSTLTTVQNTLLSTDPAAPGLLPQLLATVTGLVPKTGTPIDTIVNVVKTLPTQLNTLLTQLTTAITGLTGDQGLLHVGVIGTDQTVSPSGSGLKAQTISQVGGISVLGGLVSVDAMKSVATATADGSKGGATADVAKTTLAHVHIGSLADVQANIDKLDATVAGLGLDTVNQALGLPATSTLVSSLLSQLTGLLAQAGVQVGYIGTDVQNAAADGTSATASTQGLGIRVGVPAALGGALAAVTGPVKAVTGLDLTKPLVEIQFAPASASVSQTNAPATPQLATPAKIAGPAGPPAAKKLAYTGASLPLTAGIASVLLVGAAAANRRRRTSTV